MMASLTALQPTHGVAHVDLKPWPWKHFSWNSRLTVVLTSLPEAVWNSVLSVATEDRRFLCSMRFRTRWSRSVSLGGLPLCGWAVVAPRCFHFTITALTVDRRSFSRAYIWWTDLLERWHSMTVPRWKSLTSSVRLFHCQCLSMEIAWLCALFYTPVDSGCGWYSGIHKFQGMSTYFCIYIGENKYLIRCRFCSISYLQSM
jgi:hypothetical protein